MKRVVIFILVLIMAYLSGAFYSLSFDISYWSELCRCVVICIGLFFALSISTFPYIDKFFE
jgi:hypothetical protein